MTKTYGHSWNENQPVFNDISQGFQHIAVAARQGLVEFVVVQPTLPPTHMPD